jgi:hypothetical protein
MVEVDCLGHTLTPWAAMSKSLMSYITRSQSWEKFEGRVFLTFACDDASCRALPVVGESFIVCMWHADCFCL